MPGDKRAIHPSGIGITFSEGAHTYIDDEGWNYTSGTSFLKQFFPVFDSDKIATEKAAKDGVSKQSILDDWKEAGIYGTRVHENCENQFLGNMAAIHQPRYQKELVAFQTAWRTVEWLKSEFTLIGCELIVFHPKWYISGTIDLLMYDQRRNVYMLLDWKTNKAIYSSGFDGAKAFGVIDHLDDCNLVNYGLQLSLYERLMREGGYIPRDAAVERCLIHIPPMSETPKFMSTNDYSREIVEMVLDRAYNIPFNEQSAHLADSVGCNV